MALQRALSRPGRAEARPSWPWRRPCAESNQLTAKLGIRASFVCGLPLSRRRRPSSGGNDERMSNRRLRTGLHENIKRKITERLVPCELQTKAGLMLVRKCVFLFRLELAAGRPLGETTDGLAGRRAPLRNINREKTISQARGAGARASGDTARTGA
jgi:hypothetical protein